MGNPMTAEPVNAIERALIAAFDQVHEAKRITAGAYVPRRDAVLKALAAGITINRIAALTGYTPYRIRQIRDNTRK
jgi:hypothetical protein